MPLLVGLRSVTTKPGTFSVAFRRIPPLTRVSPDNWQGPSEEGLKGHRGTSLYFQKSHHPLVSGIFPGVRNTELGMDRPAKWHSLTEGETEA